MFSWSNDSDQFYLTVTFLVSQGSIWSYYISGSEIQIYFVRYCKDMCRLECFAIALYHWFPTLKMNLIFFFFQANWSFMFWSNVWIFSQKDFGEMCEMISHLNYDSFYREYLDLILKYFLINTKSFLALPYVEIHVFWIFLICIFVISCSKEHSKKLVRKQNISKSLWSYGSNKFVIIKTST